MVEVIPAILTDSRKELQEMLARCERAVARVQIDIIDGKFANNKTLEPDELENIDTSLKIDYQLIVEEPIKWIEKCIKGKADRIIGHVEKMTDQFEFVDRVIKTERKAGLALDLETSTQRIDPAVFEKVEVIVVMSVPAGFGGQKFKSKALRKINKLYQIRGSNMTRFKICVDGGLNYKNVKSVVKAGADEISKGKALFSGNLGSNVARYYEVVREGLS